MKKLLGIVVLSLLITNSAFPADYHARTFTDNTQKIWNLKGAEEIGYKQFVVKNVIRKTKERIEYNNLLVREFHKNFCDRKPGNYPATKEMLKFGNIDIENYPITVKFMEGSDNSYDYNVVEYKTPYKKFLNSYDAEHGQSFPYLYVICKKTKGNTSEFYSRNELISKDIDFNNMEVETTDIFDCDRMMDGHVRGLFFNPDLKFKSDEIKWSPPKKGTIGESIVLNICKKLKINNRF